MSNSSIPDTDSPKEAFITVAWDMVKIAYSQNDVYKRLHKDELIEAMCDDFNKIHRSVREGSSVS